MKKVVKRIAVTVMAMVMLIGGTNAHKAYAQSAYNVASTGGTHGKMYYDLSTEGTWRYMGISTYRLCAKSTQLRAFDGNTTLPISSINYSAAIYLETGGTSTSSGKFTSVDATWYSSEVPESMVTDDLEKGYVTHSITSLYYGSITRTLTN